MLMKFGPIEFEVFPFNTHEYSKSSASEFARKAVVGARAPLEFVGPGEESINISGRLLPKRIGGLAELATLHALMDSASAHLLMRGDGRLMGWFVIETIEEQSSELYMDGVGQIIEFSIKLCRVSKPFALSFSIGLFQDGVN